MKTEKIDMLIDTLCDYISARTAVDEIDINREIAENTKALAALVSARASIVPDYSFRE